jgi:cytidylate kinase
MRKITIAIDGHSSCGKSTMARQLAADLGYIYIDSGAMYRAVTLAAQRAGLIATDKSIDEDGLRALLPSIVITFAPDANGRLQTYLNGACVEAEIRTMTVSSCVSPIAALGFVRERLVALQQDLGRDGGIVMDGRDVGTVVFPRAELKVFVTASSRVRAERRLAELRQKGDTETTFESVLQNVEQRDYIDSHRSVGPLRQAEDARLLDNSDLTIAQQYDILMQWAQQAIEQS